MSKDTLLKIQMGVVVILVIFMYIWQVSFGHWNKWPKTTNYFDMQATAFQHGQIALLTKPDPTLLALSDPYDMELRNMSGARSIFDLSLYKGKYYLYWGPIPAIVILPIKLFYSKEMGDHLLTFWFLIGILVFNSLLALNIWKDIYYQTPHWTYLIGLITLATVNPIPWLLHRARVYQAAVSSGQFFLIGALLLAYLAFKRDKVNHIHLIFTSIFLSCAIASRLTLIFPSAFIMFMLILRYNKEKSGNAFNFHRFNLVVILPIIFCIAILGWYNKIRFDSYFEFGLKYQINEVNYPKGYPVFSLSYVPANIYNYLLNPIRPRGGFPFLQPSPSVHTSILGLTIPKTYAPVAVSGIFSTSPFVIMAGIVLYALYHKKIGGDNLRWLMITLIGTIGFSMAVLFIYFIAAMRFIEDFMPSLALLAVIGFWQGYVIFSRTRFASLFNFVGVTSALVTTSISVVLAMSSISKIPTFTIPIQISEWAARLFSFVK